MKSARVKMSCNLTSAGRCFRSCSTAFRTPSSATRYCQYATPGKPPPVCHSVAPPAVALQSHCAHPQTGQRHITAVGKDNLIVFQHLNAGALPASESCSLPPTSARPPGKFILKSRISFTCVAVSLQASRFRSTESRGQRRNTPDFSNSRHRARLIVSSTGSSIVLPFAAVKPQRRS